MKISQKKKTENRRALIQSTVDLVIERGLKAATMRAIARGAGVGDATIYNYFSSKEAILYAYYEDQFAASIRDYEALDGLGDYSFQERLQALFETLLAGFLADREFLQATFRPVFFSMPPNHGQLGAVRGQFTEAVARAFADAGERGEIQEQVFRELQVRFFWDHFLGIAAYWLRDDSELFTGTSELIDKSLGLACAMIRAGIANRIFDICTFLFRNHVLAHLDSCRAGLGTLETITKAFRDEFDAAQDSQGQAQA